MSADHAAEPIALRSIAHSRRFRREQDIYSQEDKSDSWYRVASGAARKYLTRADGRRQIVDIHLPGDYFGFTQGGRHRFSVQAVADDTMIVCYPRQRVEALADRDPSVAREIRMRSFEAISRLQEQLLIVGTMTAQEKVRVFLLYVRARLSVSNDDSNDIALPISRYDIADMLGISVETVCRAFTDLQQRGAISLQGPRRIRITQRAGHF
jgi:CRP/FNR family nitrogen fixation transcriptional regulator